MNIRQKSRLALELVLIGILDVVIWSERGRLRIDRDPSKSVDGSQYRVTRHRRVQLKHTRSDGTFRIEGCFSQFEKMVQSVNEELPKPGALMSLWGAPTLRGAGWTTAGKTLLPWGKKWGTWGLVWSGNWWWGFDTRVGSRWRKRFICSALSGRTVPCRLMEGSSSKRCVIPEPVASLLAM